MENRDEALMMFLSGELPARELALWQERIARDPELAAARDRLSALHAEVTGILDRVEARDEAALGLEQQRLEAAVRRISRTMVQRRVDPVKPPATAGEEPAQRSFLVRWSHAFVAAAVIIIGIGGLAFWSSNRVGVTPTLTHRDEADRFAIHEAIQSFTEETFDVDNSDRTALVLSTPSNDFVSEPQGEVVK